MVRGQESTVGAVKLPNSAVKLFPGSQVQCVISRCHVGGLLLVLWWDWVASFSSPVTMRSRKSHSEWRWSKEKQIFMRMIFWGNVKTWGIYFTRLWTNPSSCKWFLIAWSLTPSLSASFTLVIDGHLSNSDCTTLLPITVGLPTLGASFRLKSPARNFRNHLSTVCRDTQDGPKASHNFAHVCAAVSLSLSLNKKITRKSSREISISTVQNKTFQEWKLIDYLVIARLKHRTTTINNDFG